jgi:hypothetical protein
MAITDSGKNRIRDLIVVDISSVELGSDGTSVSVTDTDLGTSIPATSATPVITSGNKTMNISHTVLSTVANGETLREVGVFMNGDAVMLDRVVFPDLVKVNSIELTTIDLVRIG